MNKKAKPAKKPALKPADLRPGEPTEMLADEPAGKPAGKPVVKRKLKPEAIVVHVFGDLMKFAKKAPDIQAPFRKYDTFAVAMVEAPREERLMMYGFLMGLALTAHARRIKDGAKRRSVFETKNRLFLGVANNFALRKVLNFRLCQSKRFKVVKYCPDCMRKNTDEALPQRQWKFCPRCEVDRNYYNVLSMFHKHGEGGASLFLGNDLIAAIRGLRVLKRAKFGQLAEEVTFRKYTFSPKNLVALDLASTVVAAQKIADLLEKAQGSDFEKQAHSYAKSGGYPPPPPGPVNANGNYPPAPRESGAYRPRDAAGGVSFRPSATREGGAGYRPRSLEGASVPARAAFVPRAPFVPKPTPPGTPGDLKAIPGLVLKPKVSVPPSPATPAKASSTSPASDPLGGEAHKGNTSDE